MIGWFSHRSDRPRDVVARQPVSKNCLRNGAEGLRSAYCVGTTKTGTTLLSLTPHHLVLPAT